MNLLRKNIVKYAWIMTMFAMIISCQSKGQQTKQQSKFQPLSTTHHRMTQEVSNEVKDYISRHEHVTSVYAVNTFDALVIAFEVNPFDRFQLQTYKKEFAKQMQRKYPAYESIVSTDQKIILELKRLENDINAGTISLNDIQREIRRLIKLNKDNA